MSPFSDRRLSIETITSSSRPTSSDRPDFPPLVPRRPDTPEATFSFSDRQNLDDAQVYDPNSAITPMPGGGLVPQNTQRAEQHIKEQHVANYYIAVGQGGNVDLRSQNTHHHDHGERGDKDNKNNKDKNDKDEKDEKNSPKGEEHAPEDGSETTDPNNDQNRQLLSNLYLGFLKGLGSIHYILAHTIIMRLLGRLLGILSVLLFLLNAAVFLFPGIPPLTSLPNHPALNRWIFIAPSPTIPTQSAEPSASPPLSLRRPVPTEESGIMPDSVEVNWQAVVDVNASLAEELAGDFADARRKAQAYKKLNEGFVDTMEAHIVGQYRSLARLVDGIDTSLSGDDTAWSLFRESETAAAKRHLAELKGIVQRIKETRTAERDEIDATLKKIAGGAHLPVPPGICHIERALMNVKEPSEKLQDQQGGSRAMCSSERRSGVRWRDFKQAIDRCLVKVDQVELAMETYLGLKTTPRARMEAVRELAGDLMGALEQLVK